MSRRNRLLSRANTLIRKGRPPLEVGWSYVIREEAVADIVNPGRTLRLTLIFFRSRGCSFSRMGECTMCNYEVGERVDSEAMVRLVDEALNKKRHYEILFVAPLGNLFDPEEVPLDARRRILELIAATDCVAFGTETRPEFLTEEAVRKFSTVLQGKETRINIGLESSDPWVLRNCVGKSFNPESFRAVSNTLLKNGVDPVANILLGAPFLSERETLVYTVRSLRWALQNGARFCVLFPSNVKRWTLQEWLWQRGLYHCPSLWSLIEALYAVGPELSQRVALSYYDKDLTRGILERPSTCPLCHDSVVETLREYSARGDFGLIKSLRESTCACRSRWRADLLTQPALPLYDRVARLHERIACELLGSQWWEKRKAGILEQLAEEYGPDEVRSTRLWRPE